MKAIEEAINKGWELLGNRSQDCGCKECIMLEKALKATAEEAYKKGHKQGHGEGYVQGELAGEIRELTKAQENKK